MTPTAPPRANLLCSHPGCERRWIRVRDGQRVCLFHPEQHAPNTDPLTGRLRETPEQKKAREHAERQTPPDRVRAPKPTPAARTTVKPARRPSRPARPPGPAPAPFDAAAVVARYQAGEGLLALSTDLHVGHRRIRQALVDAGVTVRARGEVIGHRGPTARPVDTDEIVRLYQTLTTTQIARRLHVKVTRVADALRDAGALRPPGPRPRR